VHCHFVADCALLCIIHLYLFYTMSRKRRHHSLSNSFLNIEWLKIHSLAHCRKFCHNAIIKDPPTHLQHVTALPCEILMSEEYSPVRLGTIMLLEEELVRDRRMVVSKCCDRITSQWQISLILILALMNMKFVCRPNEMLGGAQKFDMFVMSSWLLSQNKYRRPM